MRRNLGVFLGVFLAITLPYLLTLPAVFGAEKPLLVHDYDDIDIFHACSYYKLTKFKNLNELKGETLKLNNKVEIIGSISNGKWEWSYNKSYDITVTDENIEYNVSVCAISNETHLKVCHNLTKYKSTYKDITIHRIVWLDFDDYDKEYKKEQYIRNKDIQNVRFCADIDRIWTVKGLEISVDIIPKFNGIVYTHLNWWNNTWPYRQPIDIWVSSGLTDQNYQVKLRLNSSNVGANWNWTNECNGSFGATISVNYSGSGDAAAHYGNYFYLGTGESPGKVEKIDVRDWTLVSTVILSENIVETMQTDGKYLYVGMWTSPAKIIRINITDGVFYEVDTVTLNTGENQPAGSLVASDGNLYVSCFTDPTIMVKINITDGNFSRMANLTLPSGHNKAEEPDDDGTFLYVSGEGMAPAIVDKIWLSNFTLADSLTLNANEEVVQQVLVHNDYLYVLAPKSGNFRIVKINILNGNFSRESAFTPTYDPREGIFLNGFLYVGDTSSTHHVTKINVSGAMSEVLILTGSAHGGVEAISGNATKNQIYTYAYYTAEMFDLDYDIIDAPEARARLLNGSGNTELDSFVQDCSRSMEYMDLWVEVDQNITTSNYTIYLYYGNENAGYKSEKAETLLSFDGFNRPDNNTVGNGWDERQYNGAGSESSPTYATIKNNNLRLNQYFALVEKLISQKRGIAMRARIRNTIDQAMMGILHVDDGNIKYSYLTELSDTLNHPDKIYIVNNGATYTTPTNLTDAYFNWSISNTVYTWVETALEPDNRTSVWAWFDDKGSSPQINRWNIGDTAVDGDQMVFCLNSGGDYEMFVDEVWVRKYHYPEPLYSIGAEETSTVQEIYNVTLLTPVNFINTTDNTPSHTFRVTGTYSTYNCSLIYNSSVLIYNSSTNNDSITVLTATLQSDGFYEWWINCTSGSDTKKSYTTRFITIDATPPNITFINPTPNNEIVIVSAIVVNVSIDEDGICILDWNGTNESINNVGLRNYYSSKSGLANGNYTFRAYCNDTLLNLGSTESRWVYINVTYPPTPLLSVKYCQTGNYLYERKVWNISGTPTILEKLFLCDYGCSNVTLSNFGFPGCIESDMMIAVIFISVLLGTIVWMRRVA